MKVYEAVAAALVAESCDTMFGLMGDANLALWGHIGSRSDIVIHSVRHEASAVLMANAYAQASRRVGVATVTCGPGLTHAATSIIAAARDGAPIVIITGEAPAADRHNAQVLDQKRFVEACEAIFLSLRHPDDIARLMREAFHRARTSNGPVVVNLPIDLQEQALAVPWSYLDSETLAPARSVSSRTEDVVFLTEALLAADRPIIVAGRGAVGAGDALVRLAELTGALLGTSLPAKDLFSDDPFEIGVVGGFVAASAAPLCRAADLLVGWGTQLGYHTSGRGMLFPQARVIRVDTAAVLPQAEFLPGRLVVADAREMALAVVAEIERRGSKRAGLRTPEVRHALSVQPGPAPAPEDGVDLRALMARLAPLLPDDVQVTTGGGHFWTGPIHYMRLAPQARSFYSNGFGCVGSAIPYSIGIRVATPGKPNLVIEGDGSLMQNIQELETIVRDGHQMLVLILNDAAFGAEVHKLALAGFDGALARWRSPDFAAVAKAFGGDGVTLTDIDQLEEAVARGFSHGGLFLIDARISPTQLSDYYLQTFFGKAGAVPLIRRDMAVEDYLNPST